jgi:hypothetical protein
LRYVLLLKALLRVSLFTPLALLRRNEICEEKLKTNDRTFKYHLFEAPEVLKELHRKTREWRKG